MMQNRRNQFLHETNVPPDAFLGFSLHVDLPGLHSMSLSGCLDQMFNRNCSFAVHRLSRILRLGQLGEGLVLRYPGQECPQVFG